MSRSTTHLVLAPDSLDALWRPLLGKCNAGRQDLLGRGSSLEVNINDVVLDCFRSRKSLSLEDKSTSEDWVVCNSRRKRRVETGRYLSPKVDLQK